MNFIELIGKKFDTVDLSHHKYSIEEGDEEELEEGIPPSYTVNAKDGSFAMSLNSKKKIETIWLFPLDGEFRFEDYSIHTLRKEVRKKYGKPTATGEVEASLLQDFATTWDRYDSKKTVLHFEYSAEDSKLRLITLMDAKIAP